MVSAEDPTQCVSCPAGATCDGLELLTCGDGKLRHFDECADCMAGYTCDGLYPTTRIGEGIVRGTKILDSVQNAAVLATPTAQALQTAVYE